MSATLAALIVEIRRAFQELARAGDAMHRDLGVTAAMRAVIEHLAGGKAETVPDIARVKTVSRQHIQQIVNALVAAGLAETRPNARHRRSPLIALTTRGEAVFATMQEREDEALAEIGRHFDAADIAIAVRTIRTLRRHIDPFRGDHPDDT